MSDIAGAKPGYMQRSVSTSILALLLFILLVYNGSTVFWLRSTGGDVPARFMLLANSPAIDSIKSTNLLMKVVKEETPVVISEPRLQKNENLQGRTLKRIPRPGGGEPQFKTLRLEARPKRFVSRVRNFLQAQSGSDSLCKVHFFMTWISSIDSFSEREIFAVQSLFLSNPQACLIIISTSMDSEGGVEVLKPFSKRGFRVIPIAPDFVFLFRNTPAEYWFDKLRQGEVNPGDVALGQNISNLLRLALLYKFGGVYVDTDVIILKSFSGLRNVIGAQTMDSETKKWSRLNNAVMVFDKKHPLVLEFIKEFALTFDGNKWGHNGPYLVSRVVSRVSNEENLNKFEFNFTVLPSQIFYPVDWSRVGSLFEGPRDDNHSKWLSNKLGQIYAQSFAIHLWNRQSKMLQIEDGSIIGHIIKNHHKDAKKYVFMKETSASKLWKGFEDKFKKMSGHNRLYLKKLFRLDYLPSTKINEHITAFNQLIADLRNLNDAFKDEDLALMLLASLPDEYVVVTEVVKEAGNLKTRELVRNILRCFVTVQSAIHLAKNQVFHACRKHRRSLSFCAGGY